MKKRLLSLLLVLAMVFSLMPAALAADKPSFQSFFESVPANAETEPGSPNSTNKWKVASSDGDYVLKSGGAGKSKANSTLQLTFTADAELTFEYKVSSEPNYDYFTITYDGAEKVKESGDLGWKTYTLSAESGKVLTLTYAKDSSGDKFKDCVYVRNFTAGKATVVTFHANGGVGDDYTQNFYGQAALKLNAFTKADGVFAGWATTPDGEVAYTDGAKLNPTEAMDLYAVWTPAYTVTFAYNDGTTADTTVAIACDTAIGAGAIPQPTRTGYTFGGWFAGDTALTADTVIADNTTYTAAWTANTYTVQYLPNGGTGEMAAQTFTYDAEQALTANAFTRAGYDFRGWNTSASGSSVQYTDGAAVKNLSAENNAVVKLYAVWAGQPVQVTVNRNDGSEPTVRTGVVGYNYNYIYENGSARYNQIPDPTRTGYIFLGWFDAPEGGTEITNQTKFADATPVTLYAHWQEGITVHFDGNGYKGKISDKTVRKDAVGKNLPYLSEYSYPANKALDGWYTAEEGGERVTQDTVFTESEITLYAHWRDYQYQVEFNVRYSDKSSVTGEMATVAVPFGVDYKLPACTFQREGYKFAGWSESSYGTTVKYADQATIHRDFEDDDWGDGSEDNEIYKLYAVWTKVWTVTFPNMPKDAAITVKQGETIQPVSETANTWILPNGSYTYSAELFGYESKENVPFQVNGANLEIQDTLTAADKIAVTFHVTGAAVDTAITITVWNSEKTVMTAREANPTVYDLPAGSYTYTVEAKGYKKIKNQLLTVGAAAQTVNVALTASDAWEGDSVVPTKVGDVYQITSGAELKGFADLVNGEEPGAKGILTKNITLNEPGDYAQKWTPMGASSAAAFTGDFDGNGKTISGLNPVGELISGKYRGAGLFGYVYTGGTVKNVTVEGAMKAEWNCGGVVAYLAGGRVENCVNRMNITPRSESIYLYYVGGVVGYMTNYTDNSAVIIGCRNEGSIDGGTTGENVGGVVGGASNSPGISNCANTGNISGKASIGGIAATASIPITACYNTGKITGASSKIGGIVGYSSSKVTNCYNTGAVAGAGKAGYKGVPEGVGGIAGQLYNSSNGAVAACLNSGTVTSEIYGGALVGSKNAVAAAVSGSYALAGSCTATIGSYAADDDEASFISAEELGSKRLIGLLGGAFALRLGPHKCFAHKLLALCFNSGHRQLPHRPTGAYIPGSYPSPCSG